MTLLALIAGLPSSIFILMANDTSKNRTGQVWAIILKQTAFVYVACTILLLINSWVK
jgi:hypothetical protein